MSKKTAEELANKSRAMWRNIKLLWEYICDIIEFVLTIIVTVAIVVAIICLIPVVIEYILNGATPQSFMELLEKVFVIVVGVEFLKMLCKPSADNVIEVLVFLVARHMIIGENTAADNLLSIISIAILFLIWILIHNIGKIGAAKEQKEKAADAPLNDPDVEDEGDEKL